MDVKCGSSAAALLAAESSHMSNNFLLQGGESNIGCGIMTIIKGSRVKYITLIFKGRFKSFWAYMPDISLPSGTLVFREDTYFQGLKWV